MTNVRIIYNNLWRSGLIFAKSSQNPQYPVEDVQIDSPLIPWRSATGSLNEYISLNAGSAVQYDFIGLVNHNAGSGATINYYGADNSAFNSGLVTDALTYNNKNIFRFLSASRLKQYQKLGVVDASNPSNYIQAGAIWAAKFWEPETSFLTGYSDGYDDASEGDESDARVFFAQEKPRLRINRLPFRLNDADKAEAMTFLRMIGLTKSFLVCLDYNYPNSNTYLVMNTGLAEPVYRGVNNWSWMLMIRQVAGS